MNMDPRSMAGVAELPALPGLDGARTSNASAPELAAAAERFSPAEAVAPARGIFSAELEERDAH